jgi:magnesium chelatase family protein
VTGRLPPSGLFVNTIAIVGLPDKAVSEARERVRSALIASGLALPARRITVNLAPADCRRKAAITICRLRSA